MSDKPVPERWRSKYDQLHIRNNYEDCGLYLRLIEEIGAAEAALRRLNSLFMEPSPFYIGKGGSPITNGDQALIDEVFAEIEAALPETAKP